MGQTREGHDGEKGTHVAIKRKYEKQMPFVGTDLMKQYLDEESERRQTSIARIIREALDERYLLRDGEGLPLEEQADLAQQIATRAARRAASLAEQVAAREMDKGGTAG